MRLPTGGTKDVKDISVEVSGKDTEYWAGSYGAFFKDMQLTIEGPGATTVDLISPDSDWHLNQSTAIASSTAEEGTVIVFSYDFDSVWASVSEATMPQGVDWDRLTQLNFDTQVMGHWPNHSDTWWVKVCGYTK